MPRKYRPPAARRRKSKRPAPYYVEPLPDEGDGASPAAAEAVPAAQAVETAPPPRPGDGPAPAGSRSTSTTARHIARDYSYVRAEVRRIVLVAGFLIISLIITALLRN